MRSDVIFVSHAHTDHLCRRIDRTSCATVLASQATSQIARARGFSITDNKEKHDGFELLDSGHILGSKGLLIDKEIYYTGDISIRERGFMRPAIVPNVSTLLVESTFGRPEYVFPDMSATVHKTNKIISECYNNGTPTILMGYSLGKAQILTELFRHWEPVYTHDSVHYMNSLYIDLGIKLRGHKSFSEAESDGSLSRRSPWLLIAPLMHCGNNFIRQIKEKYGAITIGFTGWAVNQQYKFMMGLDYAIPMSDHCDYSELLRVVKKCKAKKIYTVHGFATDFANNLKRVGFDAESLSSNNGSNSSLDRYL